MLVGFGLGFGVAHLLAGYIAYWDVVSGPFFLSLRVASAATVIAGVTGVASGYVLAKGRFPGRDVLETIGSLPIILPPTVIGYYLLEVLSPGTQVGGFLTRVTGHVLRLQRRRVHHCGDGGRLPVLPAGRARAPSKGSTPRSSRRRGRWACPTGGSPCR